MMRCIAMLRGLVDRCSVDGGGAAAITSQNPASSGETTRQQYHTQQQQSLAPGMGFCVDCYINLLLNRFRQQVN